MAWYRAGTVTVANGSAVVTGTNTDFVANTQQGEAFLGPDGRVYEVAQVVSATQIVLGMNYQGGSAGAQSYALMPTSSFARDLALGAAQLLNTFAAVRDGIGAGMFPDGSAATPGIRFAADQDTGFRRIADNYFALVAGGGDRLKINAIGIEVNGKITVGSPTDANIVFSTNAANWSAGVPDGTNRWRISENQFGSEHFTVLANGNVGIGTTVPQARFHVKSSGEIARFETTGTSGDAYAAFYKPIGPGVDRNGRKGFLGYGSSGGDESFFLMNEEPGPLIFGTNSQQMMRLNEAGDLLIGVAGASSHTIAKGNTEGDQILNISGLTHGSGYFYSGGNGQVNGAAATLRMFANGATNRSINAAGTVNANGADYAEYMTKAPGCGLVQKGDVCGVDRQGQITRSWADAITFKIKSTDPNLVGGDTWAAHLGAPPVQPSLVLPQYDGPDEPAEPANDAATDDYARDRAAYDAAQTAHAGEVAAAKVAHETALVEYEATLATFEADLETARQTVDRIAYCGRVPVNFADVCEPGDYLVAIANGGGIGLKAVAEADITFADYRRRVGRVLSIGEDSRPIVDVMQG